MINTAETASTPPHIHAVVVVCDRYERLKVALASIQRQRLTAERIWIVDNTPTARRQTIAIPDQARWLRCEKNLGGAGGYAYGIIAALAAGAEYVLLIDDDGVLQGENYIGTALTETEVYDLDLVAPLAIDEADPTLLCFPFPTPSGRTYRLDEVDDGKIRSDVLHLFNGTFARAATFLKYGVPDIQLYLRGDEVDFLYRLRGSGGKVATSAKLKVSHPTSALEAHKILGTRLMAIDPMTSVKRELTFRNRGYIFLRHRRYIALLLDILRYAAYFCLTRKGDFSGFADWLKLTWRGMNGRLGPPGC